MPRSYPMVILLLLVSPPALALDILTPGDPILAIDLDVIPFSSYPDGEGPGNVADQDSGTKYLNFSGEQTGFIVTPSFGSSTIQSLRLTTANDFEPRDPASYNLYGTNDLITSGDNSLGDLEDWTLIDFGSLSLPADRVTPGAIQDFTNSTSYTSYKVIFPTLKGGPEMQVADVSLFTGAGGSGSQILAGFDPALAVTDKFGSESDYPGAESPANAIDRDVNTKYLNFGQANSGFIATPSVGSTTVDSFQITTANDADGRDPSQWELYGTNDAITSTDNSAGDGESWTLIDSGSIVLPIERLTPGDVVSVNNSAGAFTSYRMVFPEVFDLGEDSMQISEIQLFQNTPFSLEVNRDTGGVRILAEADGTFSSYELQSAEFGGIDDSQWNPIGDTGDPDDDWERTSDPGDPNTLGEADSPTGANNGFSLTAGNSYSLGNVWTPTPLEDLTAAIRDAAGNFVGNAIAYVGDPVIAGDYNRDGSVTILDWPMFLAGFGGEYADATPVQAYLGGDLDGDLDSDLYDLNLFVAAAGGAAVLFGSGVPEPSSLTLLAAAVVIGCGWRTRGRRGSPARRHAITRVNVVRNASFLAVGTLIVGIGVTPVCDAQTFTNLGNVSVVSSPDPSETEESGPENLFDDTALDGNPTAINSQLFVADYADPALGDLLQYAGLGADPKRVFMDFGTPINANWFAYAQRAGGDPTADRVGTFEFWFSDTDFGETLPGTDPDAVFSLRPNDPRVVDSILRPYPLSGEQTGRYVAARLTVSDLSAGQPTNNIGGHEFRLLSGPSDIVLEVDRSNGNMTMRNDGTSAQAIEIRGYTIESQSGALDAGSFDGIGGDVPAFPPGDGTGNGWEVGGGSNATRLAEANFSGSSTLPIGETGLSLGEAYQESSLSEDLFFTYTNNNGHIYDGRVAYVGEFQTTLPGDMNGDGQVNFGDLSPFALGLTNIPGYEAQFPELADTRVQRGDVNLDTAFNFGDLSPFVDLLTSGQASGQTVPEPASLMLISLALFPLIFDRNRCVAAPI